MKVAILTTDNREQWGQYDGLTPLFGMAPDALLQGFALMPEVEVHVISGTRRIMKSPEKLAPNTWFHSVYTPRIGWTPTCFQGCVRSVRRKLRQIQPDIVHGQGTERDCALSAVFSGFPNVLTIHGNMRLIAAVNHAKPLSWYWQAAQLERVVLPRTNGVVCITRYTQDAVKDLARKTWVLPNAVDGSFYNVQSAPDPARIILFVGQVNYRKNQNGFIRALDAIAGNGRFKVVFLGAAAKDHPYSAEFFELLTARPWCEHTGFADREKLRGWFQRASLLALPSREDNCPLVVLEAMAAGVPVLAAKVGGIPELIEDRRTGLFCDPEDPASMRDGVNQLLNDAGLAQKLSLNGKAEARGRFHPLVIARGHVEIYNEVLGRRP